jgi:chromosome partitioning protein
MHTVAVVNRKGGAGKTTLAMNLAGVLSAEHRLLVVDADPQQSATRWKQQGGGGQLRFTVHPLDAEAGAAEFKSALLELAATHRAEIVVVDCPPELTEATMVALLLADLAMVPVGPSPLDLWAAEAAVALAEEARALRDDSRPEVALVPSRLMVGTVLARELADTLAALGPVAPGVAMRVAVAEAAIGGETVAEYAPRSQAHREFQAVARYVLERLGGIGGAP